MYRARISIFNVRRKSIKKEERRMESDGAGRRNEPSAARGVITIYDYN